MAIHTELPIYKLTYELMLLAMELTKHMPRELKATMGRKLHEECFSLTILVYRANCATEKTPYLDRLLERVQVAEMLFRLARDMRAISTGQYTRGIALTDKIGKQGNGWRKYSASSPAAPPSRR